MSSNSLDEQSLLDLSVGLKDIIVGKQGIFYEYEDKKIIGNKIKAALLKKYNDTTKSKARKQGFYLSDDVTSVGVLSQCHSLQCLLALIDGCGVEIDEKTNNIILSVLDDIIENVIRPEGFVFDASPYDAKFDVNMPYMDSLTWVMSTMLSCLRLSIRTDVCFDIGEQRYAQAVSIIKECLNIICDSYISNSQSTGENALNKGWNFTTKCEEPSLYFCFAVSEVYLDFYKTFEAYILTFENMRRKEKGIAVIEDAKTVADRNAYLNSEEGIKLAKLFQQINNGEPFLAGSPYCKFEGYLRDVAIRVWELVKDKFTESFFNSDLATTVSEDIINQSSTNDALFNSVYIINILINGAYDEMLNDEIMAVSSDGTATVESEQKLAQAQATYDNFLETIQLAYQRAYRCYNQLKNDDKEHIVEQYVLGFNEKFTLRRDSIKELRKKRIKVFSLFPLLVKTNSIIGEYLIKYPQYEMIKYLDSVMANRYAKRVVSGTVLEYEWFWEADGYYSASNYYYATSITSFYDYYETYEKRFFEVEKANVKVVEEVKKEYFSELNKGNGEIGILKKKIELLKAENEKLSSKESKFENATTEFISEYISTNSVSILTKLFLKVTDCFTADVNDNVKLTKEEEKMQTAMREAFFSIISPILYKVVRYNSSIADKAECVERLKQYVKEDIQDCLGKYASQLLNTSNHQSEYSKTDALKGISDVLMRNTKNN